MARANNNRFVYLCTLDELAGSSGEGRTDELMALLASILSKLGYVLVSGEAPNFHELWAARVEGGVATEGFKKPVGAVEKKPYH